jgi:RNA polymerase sigma-70 factor (ECF subfamily)
MAPAGSNSEETNRLLRNAAAGDQQSWGGLLMRYREPLRRMVALRLDDRLRGRIDPEDVVQEAFLQASLQLPRYLQEEALPFFLWLRLVTCQRLSVLHRHHLQAHCRTVDQELSLNGWLVPTASSSALASRLLGREMPPSAELLQDELRDRVQHGLDRLEALDREVLTLRHFEQLSNADTAQVLGIQESAASKRYVRALQRLKEVLQDMPGGLGELQP